MFVPTMASATRRSVTQQRRTIRLVVASRTHNYNYYNYYNYYNNDNHNKKNYNSLSALLCGNGPVKRLLGSNNRMMTAITGNNNNKNKNKNSNNPQQQRRQQQQRHYGSTTTCTTTTTTRRLFSSPPWTSRWSTHHHNNDKDNNDDKDKKHPSFTTSWQRAVQDLIHTVPVGRWTAVHWEQAQTLCKALRTHRALDRSTAATLQGFALLDRLAVECSSSSSSSSPIKNEKRQQGDSSGNALLLHCPLDLRVLGAVVGAWKRILAKGEFSHDDDDSSRPNKNNRGSRPNTATLFPLTAPQILAKIEEYRQVGLFEPNAITYNVLMDALRMTLQQRKEQDSALTVRLAYQMYNHLRAASAGNPFDTEMHPNQITILNLLHVLIAAARHRHHGDPSQQQPGTTSSTTAQQAEHLVQQLQGWYAETKRPDMAPTLKIYTALVKAHQQQASSSSSASSSSVMEMIRIANEAWAACKRGALAMDLVALNGILHALAATKDTMAANAADTILQELITAYQKGRNQELHCPNQVTFLAVLSAMGRSGQAERAEQVMEQMEDLYYQSSQNPHLKPNKACYGALIWAYVKTGDASQAEATLLRMSNMYDLDAESWSGVLAAWAQSGELAERTASVIQMLEKEYGDHDSSSSSSSSSSLHGAANVTTYNALMSNHANSKNPQQGALLATDLFQWMEEHKNEKLRPDGISYLSLITAWKNAGNPEQAESVLQLALQKIRDEDPHAPRIEARHFNLCLSAWADSKHAQAAKRARAIHKEMERLNVAPNIVTYNVLLKVYARHEHPRTAARKCLSLLRETQRLAHTGQLEQGPDTYSYNTAISALGRSGDAGDMANAVKLFTEMQHRGLEPCRATYNNFMTIFARQGNPEKVQSILRFMQDAANSGESRVKPHFKAFTTLLQSWASDGKPEATLAVLEEMIQLSERGELDGKPGTRDFNAVLQAWLKSGRPDSFFEALRVLKKMEEFSQSNRFNCAPDSISYNIVIRLVCCEADQGKRALALLRTMQKPLNPVVRPDITTYSQVMAALVHTRQLSVDALSDIDGLVDELVAQDAAFWSSPDRTTRQRFANVVRQITSSKLDSANIVLQKLVRLMEDKGIRLNKAPQASVEEWGYHSNSRERKAAT